MKQLEETILVLQSDPFSAIKVENIGFGNDVPIVINATNKDLIDKYGSATNFFESLYANGIKKIRVTHRKQNGKIGNKTNFKNSTTHPPFTVEFESKSEPMNNQSMNNNNGLNAGFGMTGADIYKVHDHERIKTELIEVKAELLATKRELEKAKEENLKHELLGTKKVETAEAQGKLAANIAPIVQQLMPFLMAGRAPQPGLSQPLSPVKQAFMNADDALLQDLFLVSKGYEIPGFEDELTELMKKYNLIQVENVS